MNASREALLNEISCAADGQDKEWGVGGPKAMDLFLSILLYKCGNIGLIAMDKEEYGEGIGEEAFRNEIIELAAFLVRSLEKLPETSL